MTQSVNLTMSNDICPDSTSRSSLSFLDNKDHKSQVLTEEKGSNDSTTYSYIWKQTSYVSNESNLPSQDSSSSNYTILYTLEPCSDVASANSQAQKPKLRRKTGAGPPYSSVQYLALERTFLLNKFPSKIKRIKLAKELSLSERKIRIWFQNRRIKEKKVNSSERTRNFCKFYPNANHNISTGKNKLTPMLHKTIDTCKIFSDVTHNTIPRKIELEPNKVLDKKENKNQTNDRNTADFTSVNRPSKDSPCPKVSLLPAPVPTSAELISKLREWYRDFEPSPYLTFPLNITPRKNELGDVSDKTINKNETKERNSPDSTIIKKLSKDSASPNVTHLPTSMTTSSELNSKLPKWNHDLYPSSYLTFNSNTNLRKNELVHGSDKTINKNETKERNSPDSTIKNKLSKGSASPNVSDSSASMTTSTEPNSKLPESNRDLYPSSYPTFNHNTTSRKNELEHLSDTTIYRNKTEERYTPNYTTVNPVSNDFARPKVPMTTFTEPISKLPEWNRDLYPSLYPILNPKTTSKKHKLEHLSDKAIHKNKTEERYTPDYTTVSPLSNCYFRPKVSPLFVPMTTFTEPISKLPERERGFYPSAYPTFDPNTVYTTINPLSNGFARPELSPWIAPIMPPTEPILKLPEWYRGLYPSAYPTFNPFPPNSLGGGNYGYGPYWPNDYGYYDMRMPVQCPPDDYRIPALLVLGSLWLNCDSLKQNHVLKALLMLYLLTCSVILSTTRKLITQADN